MKAELDPEYKCKQGEESAEEKEEESRSEGEETTGEGKAGGGVRKPSSDPKETEQSSEIEEVTKEGAESTGAAIKVEYLPLDLSSFQSTIDCVCAFKERSLPLHILVNNAALAWTPFGEGIYNTVSCWWSQQWLVTVILRLSGPQVPKQHDNTNSWFLLLESMTSAESPSCDMMNIIGKRSKQVTDNNAYSTYVNMRIYLNFTVVTAFACSLEKSKRVCSQCSVLAPLWKWLRR